MKLLTASLEGKALDWALAVALEKNPALSFRREVVVSSIMGWLRFDHTDPAVWVGLLGADAGMVRNIHVAKNSDENGRFWVWGKDVKTAGNFKPIECQAFGSTLSIAIARCVVQMRLGDEVDVPDELCGVDHG